MISSLYIILSLLLSKLAVLYKLISTGVIASISFCIEFFKANDEDNAVIVINNIKHIILILITVVLILLCICLSTNMFVPFKYILLFDSTIFKIKPDIDQNIKIVVIIPNIIASTIAFVVSLMLDNVNTFFVTIQYAYPNPILDIINITTHSIGFFIFIFSFFLDAVNKLISLYLEIVKALNINTAKYIIAKYKHVLMQAFFENTNSNLVMSAWNNFATKIDISCETKIPITNPINRDIIPTNIVSIKSILDICLLLIPSVMYIPNSFFRLFIRKLFAYTINKPNIIAINTDTIPSILIISLIISLVEDETFNIAS